MFWTVQVLLFSVLFATCLSTSNRETQASCAEQTSGTDDVGLLQRSPVRQVSNRLLEPDDDVLLQSKSGHPPRTACEMRALDPNATERKDMIGTVVGIATNIPGNYKSSTFEFGFAVQDDSGCGIYVTLLEPPTETIGVGCHVEVEADIGTMAKMIVMTNVDEIEIHACEVPEPVDATPVKTGDVGEANEGLLVVVEGKITQGVAGDKFDDMPYGYKMWIDDGSGEIQIFANIVNTELGGCPSGHDECPVFDVNQAKEGCHMKATGLSARYEDWIEVMPRGPEDVEITCDGDDDHDHDHDHDHEAELDAEPDEA